jgi:hypothetical protein
MQVSWFGNREQWRKNQNACTFTRACVHLHVRMYIYMCVCTFTRAFICASFTCRHKGKLVKGRLDAVEGFGEAGPSVENGLANAESEERGFW